MLKIGLLWHSFTSDNLGVGALSVSHCAIIEGICKELGIDAEYYVFGTEGGKDYYSSSGVNIKKHYTISRKTIFEGSFSSNGFIVGLKECDLVFDIGEGDSFTDIYGYKRFILLALTKQIVIGAKTPLVLSPQTIGPFQHRMTRTAANFLMNRADKVFARDFLSLSYLENEGIRNSAESIDVAFQLPFEKTNVNSDKTKIGINVSGLLYNGGYTRKNQFGFFFDYSGFIKNLIGQLQKDIENEIYLVPHVISDSIEIEDDYRVAVSLKSMFPDVKLSPKFQTPSEAKTFISGMDFFTGARMHSTIAAFSSGVPVVPLAYSRKFRGLFESLGYQHLSDGTEQHENEIMGFILDAVKRRDLLKEDVLKGNKIAASKIAIYKDYLRQLLGDLNVRK